MGISTVTAVQTQGNSPWADWVATFRLKYSLDCGTFQPVLDNTGNEKVVTDLNEYVGIIGANVYETFTKNSSL